MHPISKKIVTDESMRPVAVQIDYADWLEVERLLGLNGSNGQTGSVPGSTDLNRFAGSISLGEDPVQFQRRIRGEWP
jgi:hypothetical protein